MSAPPAARGFFDHAIEAAIPLSLQWDLTWRCDHSCVHCYLTQRRQDELTLEQCLGILDQLVDAGTMSILFSGGDLFLRKDAVQILRAARDRDFDVRINTHGNHIDDGVADALAEIEVCLVNLSVYSAEAGPHEAITLIEGSHAKTLEAARRLTARGVPVRFKTPVMEHNRLSYHRVGQLAKQMGASWEMDASIVPDDQSDFGLCSIGVDPTDRMLALLTAIEGQVEEPIHEIGDVPSSSRTCSAGTASAYIGPDGTLTPCINWREPLGSLKTVPFAELWWKSAEAERLREVRRATYLQDCEGCGFHGKCSYCPGLSHAETGDAGRRSPYVCERTHMTMGALEYAWRLKESGQPVPEPGSPEAAALFDGLPTFAERQMMARREGLATQADRLPLKLINVAHQRRIEKPAGSLIHIEEPQGS